MDILKGWWKCSDLNLLTALVLRCRIKYFWHIFTEHNKGKCKCKNYVWTVLCACSANNFQIYFLIDNLRSIKSIDSSTEYFQRTLKKLKYYIIICEGNLYDLLTCYLRVDDTVRYYVYICYEYFYRSCNIFTIFNKILY